jgi:hypothetical protein
VDARIILGFQTGHGAPNGNPRTGHDKQVYAPFASVHWRGRQSLPYRTALPISTRLRPMSLSM